MRDVLESKPPFKSGFRILKNEQEEHYMELDAVLRERRSMRKYQPDRKVSREQVEEILKAATLAPSWKNSQTARYYVVMSDDMLKNVKETCLPS